MIERRPRTHPVSVSSLLFIGSFMLPALACSVTTSGGSAEGGAPPSGNALANGTCTFQVEGKTYNLPGFATMNGSGNLRMPFTDGTVSLELRAGNGTYKGPGDYTFAPQLLDGDLTLNTPDADYDATVNLSGNDPRTACTITITPITDFAPKGSQIQGTFHCTAVHYRNRDGGGDGGASDILNGAFNVVIR